MSNMFKVGDWVIRNPSAIGNAWMEKFPHSHSLPKRVEEVGDLGEIVVDGWTGLDCYFFPAPKPKPLTRKIIYETFCLWHPSTGMGKQSSP